MQEWVFYGNTLRDWLVALGVALGTLTALHAVRWLILRQLVRLAEHTRTTFDDIIIGVLRRTRVAFILFLALYAGLRTLTLPPSINFGIRIIGVLVITLQLAFWGNELISGLIQRQIRKRLAEDPSAATTMNALGFLGRLVLFALLLVLGLDNLGVNITALVTGLGIGGIAIALALQTVLGDLFGSLSIVLDRPFQIGDFIIVGTEMGTVEDIGLKTTRVRSLSGEQLIFSNSDLLGSRIRNYKRMSERRIVFTLGVTYQTPRALLEAIPAMIRETIESIELTRFDRSHFKTYGAFSLDFETVYWVKDPDFNRYMDIQQAINLGVHRRFEEAGIEFAYPTQTLFLERGPTYAETDSPQRR